MIASFAAFPSSFLAFAASRAASVEPLPDSAFRVLVAAEAHALLVILTVKPNLRGNLQDSKNYYLLH